MAESRPASTRRKRFSVDALFADTSTRAVGVTDLLDAKQIQVERIEPDPEQPRSDFDPDALEELAASIRMDGILQPIAVRYDDRKDMYIIVHGERRWRAAKMAGLSSVPAIVRDVPEERRLIQQLAENVVREDLNALDRAAALRALKERMNDAPWEQVAAAVGIRRSRLFQLLSTEKLDPVLQDALRRGIISEKQTRPVHALPADEQRSLAASLIDGHISAQDVEKSARSRKRAPDARVPLTSEQLAKNVLRHAHELMMALEQLEQAHASLSERSTDRLASNLRDAETRIDAFLSTIGDR
jgi:ParB family transcriptional regulator, chromosome partitioning protein